MAPEYSFFLAGQWRKSGQPLDVVNPFDGHVVGTTFYASSADLEEATVAA